MKESSVINQSIKQDTQDYQKSKTSTVVFNGTAAMPKKQEQR